MKKIIALLSVITLTLLFITKSLYVEGTELIIIIGALVVVSIVFNRLEGRVSVDFSRSIIIGFLFFWVLSVIDIVVDHFIYFLPTGNEDGIPLTLGMKINEFNDDLFVASLISMVLVFLLSMVTAFIFKGHKADV